MPDTPLGGTGPDGHEGRGIEGLPPDRIYETILHNLPETLVFVFGTDLRVRLVEGAGFARLGWSRDEIIGRRPGEVMSSDPQAAAQFEDCMRAALAGETCSVEMAGLRHADIYWRSTMSPLVSPEGEIVGGLIVARNLAPLRRAEADRFRSEMEAARWSEAAETERRLRERLEFLAGMDSVLANCRDRTEIMRAVTGAAVPRLGDWCSIHVLMDPHDTLPVTEVGHVDPAMVRVAKDFVERFPYEPDAGVGLPYVIRTGQPVLMTGIDPAQMEAAAADPIGVAAIRQLDLTSSLIVPLSVGGQTFGALTFSVSGRERTLDEDDLALAHALAGRVAVSMENRRLSEVEREISRTLQRSLLPEALPEVAGADVAVRYWAAGEGTEVGGDFYDVFDTGHGSHAVVIGDVCGNGPAAAAVTASARHTIRALARHGDDHATVMRQLNDALLTSWPDVFCTVVYATLAPSDRGLRLTVVSGGHPLPIVVSPDGTAHPVGRHGMLVGAFAIPAPEPVEVDLVPGDTVVFYTDGVYDMPPPRYLSEDEVISLAAGCAIGATDAAAVADAIAGTLEATVPFGERDDDIAVVVVRVTGVPAQP